VAFTTIAVADLWILFVFWCALEDVDMDVDVGNGSLVLISADAWDFH